MIDAQSLGCPIDAHQIIKRLWQGSWPAPGTRLRDCGFDVIVLCAEEIPCREEWYSGVEVICAGIDDGLVTPELERTARRAAKQVLAALHTGKRVLVTCAQGRNRSGLVNGLVLRELLVRDVVGFIQSRRPNSLTNPHFRELLRGRQVEWIEERPAAVS